MELNTVYKVRSIKLPKKIIETIDIVEIKPKERKKPNLKNGPVSIIKSQVKENNPLVIIETGPFLIQL